MIAAIGAIAELGLPVRVLDRRRGRPRTCRAATPTGPATSSRAANGKTIEITNTDAEGRLVLADALWYAREQGATHVLDLATLTGAMEVALGDLYAGVFANDDAWRDRDRWPRREASGDHAWPFPLHPRYRRYIDSDVRRHEELVRPAARAAPSSPPSSCEEFAGEGPWAHVDIAGPAFLERGRAATTSPARRHRLRRPADRRARHASARAA